MPENVGRPILVQLIQRRVRSALPDFDVTGLPEVFPFGEEHLRQAEREPTIRIVLRDLSNKFNEIVFGPADHYKIVSPHEELRKRLQDRWDAELIAAKKLIESEFQTRPSLIPEVQTSLDRWLTFLRAFGKNDGKAEKYAFFFIFSERSKERGDYRFNGLGRRRPQDGRQLRPLRLFECNSTRRPQCAWNRYRGMACRKKMEADRLAEEDRLF